MIETADDPAITIEPAWKISTVYGMPCAIYNLLPTAYYLAARFRQDFESAVLHAVNGGGHNQARAMLTGSLVGAQVGLSGIPTRFLKGLSEHEELIDLTIKFALATGVKTIHWLRWKQIRTVRDRKIFSLRVKSRTTSGSRPLPNRSGLRINRNSA